eukprot:g54201.t1
MTDLTVNIPSKDELQEADLVTMNTLHRLNTEKESFMPLNRTSTKDSTSSHTSLPVSSTPVDSPSLYFHYSGERRDLETSTVSWDKPTVTSGKSNIVQPVKFAPKTPNKGEGEQGFQELGYDASMLAHQQLTLALGDGKKNEVELQQSPNLQRETSATAEVLAAFARSVAEHDEINIAHPWYIILPSSYFHFVWTSLLIIGIGFCALWVPLELAFTQFHETKADLSVEVLFILDILVNFVTAYHTDNFLLVTDLRLIAKRYISTWFIVDLLACYPMYLHNELHRYPSLFFLRFLRLLRVTKLTQNRLEGDILTDWFYSHFVDRRPQLWRSIKLVWVIFITSHICGCLFLYAGNIDNPASWMLGEFDGLAIADFDKGVQYLLAMYWAITTILTVGYGDIVANTVPEVRVAIFTECTGLLVFSYITGIAVALVSTENQREQEFRDKMQKLVSFMNKNALPANLQHSIRSHASANWMRERSGKGVTLEEIKPLLPRSLQHDLCMYLYTELIAKSSFLSSLIRHFPAFAKELLAEFTPVQLRYGEVAAPGYWYVVGTGVVEIKIGDMRLQPPLLTGRSFGLKEMFLEGNTGTDTPSKEASQIPEEQYVAAQKGSHLTVLYAVSLEDLQRAMDVLDETDRAQCRMFFKKAAEQKQNQLEKLYQHLLEKRAQQFSPLKRTRSRNPSEGRERSKSELYSKQQGLLARAAWAFSSNKEKERRREASLGPHLERRREASLGPHLAGGSPASDKKPKQERDREKVSKRKLYKKEKTGLGLGGLIFTSQVEDSTPASSTLGELDPQDPELSRQSLSVSKEKAEDNKKAPHARGWSVVQQHVRKGSFRSVESGGEISQTMQSRAGESSEASLAYRRSSLPQNQLERENRGMALIEAANHPTQKSVFFEKSVR